MSETVGAEFRDATNVYYEDLRGTSEPEVLALYDKKLRGQATSWPGQWDRFAMFGATTLFCTLGLAMSLQITRPLPIRPVSVFKALPVGLLAGAGVSGVMLLGTRRDYRKFARARDLVIATRARASDELPANVLLE